MDPKPQESRLHGKLSSQAQQGIRFGSFTSPEARSHPEPVQEETLDAGEQSVVSSDSEEYGNGLQPASEQETFQQLQSEDGIPGLESAPGQHPSPNLFPESRSHQTSHPRSGPEPTPQRRRSMRHRGPSQVFTYPSLGQPALQTRPAVNAVTVQSPVYPLLYYPFAYMPAP